MFFSDDTADSPPVVGVVDMSAVVNERDILEVGIEDRLCPNHRDESTTIESQNMELHRLDAIIEELQSAVLESVHRKSLTNESDEQKHLRTSSAAANLPADADAAVRNPDKLDETPSVFSSPNELLTLSSNQYLDASVSSCLHDAVVESVAAAEGQIPVMVTSESEVVNGDAKGTVAVVAMETSTDAKDVARVVAKETNLHIKDPAVVVAMEMTQSVKDVVTVVVKETNVDVDDAVATIAKNSSMDERSADEVAIDVTAGNSSWLKKFSQFLGKKPEVKKSDELSTDGDKNVVSIHSCNNKNEENSLNCSTSDLSASGPDAAASNSDEEGRMAVSCAG